MTAIVKGHGSDRDGKDTFLPEGVTVRMYSRERVALKSAIGLLVLLDEAGDPGEQITGTIKNYTLTAHTDEQMARWYALAGESNIPIWWVGNEIPDGTRLCEDPNDGTDEATCRPLGQHTCTGVLGLVQDRDIAIVACRSSKVEPRSDEWLPTSYDPRYNNTVDVRRDLLKALKSKDASRVADAERRFDLLEQEDVALLTTAQPLHDWLCARWLKIYAEGNKLEDVFAQLESNMDGLDGIMAWLDTIPSYGEALDNVARTYPDVFVLWVKEASAAVSVALTRRKAIRKLRGETVAAWNRQRNAPTSD